MTPTDVSIPSEVFNFTGQSTIDTWALKNNFSDMGWSAYEQWMADEFILSMQKIKELADSFPFWQRVKDTGRKPIKERDLLIAFLLRQFFDTTFRLLVGYMKIFEEYFQFEMIPHHSVMSRYNRSKRILSAINIRRQHMTSWCIFSSIFQRGSMMDTVREDLLRQYSA